MVGARTGLEEEETSYLDSTSGAATRTGEVGQPVRAGVPQHAAVTVVNVLGNHEFVEAGDDYIDDGQISSDLCVACMWNETHNSPKQCGSTVSVYCRPVKCTPRRCGFGRERGSKT